ncbi:O-glucosyltransferase rumi-like [Heracleum sosnowskyi]|uniref:O-glucosyltransferase rumi-like n=1 Tax=Heracleum sosnowskyi TaxID=360622 RepID=A0AAD8H7C4_9APIA|nr:O-glucosyltransferase rumi-like [Heracleum sosnowskyi]
MRFPQLGRSSTVRSSQIFLCLVLLCAAIFVSLRLLETTNFVNKVMVSTINNSLNCPDGNNTRTCPANNDLTRLRKSNDQGPSTPRCPNYFRWIHEDLRPWKETGITLDMVERANRTANFRLVILDGRAYVQTYIKGFQTRDNFTQWGILQLLRRYPGRVPDLDLMFDCVDWPVIRSADYPGSEAKTPPPLFRYCGDSETLDIVFPDWSFWGWPETDIGPWEIMSEEIIEGNKKSRWKDREPYAYWKGNPKVAEKRKELLKCNVSDQEDWNARIFIKDWDKELEQGSTQSGLTDQCQYRYKIYIEGSAWSVSQKYILACDSVCLVVTPRYYDFFTRGLMPMEHYWPIREDDKCKSIKFAVDYGNIHELKAQTMTGAANKFVQEDLHMDYVYDYMFHLLSEYSKLLRYKPTIPENAIELCPEAMACPAKGLANKYMRESLVTAPIDRNPCTMLPPYDKKGLRLYNMVKESSLKRVRTWENNYWNSE